jgi:trehalose 6-phosphate synthase/phosphatase
LDGAGRSRLLRAYRKSARRLLFLDYDGTLAPIVLRPEDAAPNPGLLDLLRSLAAESKNTVVIISGRDRWTLQSWLGEVGADLVAEHGAQIRRAGDTRWKR